MCIYNLALQVYSVTTLLQKNFLDLCKLKDSLIDGETLLYDDIILECQYHVL